MDTNLLGQRSVAQIRASDVALLQSYTRSQIAAGTPVNAIDLGSGTPNYKGDPDVVRFALTPEDRTAFTNYNATNPNNPQGAAGRIFSLDRPFVNISTSEHEGWDFGVRYVLPRLPLGNVVVNSEWAYLQKSKSTLAPANLPPTVNHGLYANGAARWRGTSNVAWRKDAWSAALAAYYVGKTHDASSTTTGAIYESPDRRDPPTVAHPGPPAPPSGTVVNHFVAPATALRYATSRPSSHARVLALLEPMLMGHLPVSRALDVGCGTGHSTHALLPYAQVVVGVDSSSEMLVQASRHDRIQYCKGHAEALPCRAHDFDLVTVSSAYHWFDHERFLGEAARVLRTGGWLVLYKTGSTKRPTDQPDFEHWRRAVLNAHYPKVVRNNEPLTRERAAEFGFSELFCETFAHQQHHTLDDYIENILTHSSVIRVVDGGYEPIGAARTWLRSELARFFPTGITEFTHEARIHILRREPRS